MKLMSLSCPNCNGPLKPKEEGKFYCENCGSEFLADYDSDDVEYQKIRTEAEVRKQQMHLAQSGMVVQDRRTKDQFRIKLITIAAVLIFLLIIVVPTVIFTLQQQKRAMENSLQQQWAREAQREAEEKAREEKRRQEEEARKAAEEAERQAKLASYRLTQEELTSDPFFVENANQAILGQLWDNTNLFYNNWVWNEAPEYMTSYFLVAKDENNRKQNILLSIYKIHWDKEFDDRTEHYIMYDGACLYNVSRNEDGTITSDYAPHEMTYSSEIVANQFLSGYTDYDQLIRQEIYGNADYDHTEFTMPGASPDPTTFERRESK
ncbi:MAG: TFIIB-type zinc ribbon-containing protein [Lachnospiraceae bacterium]|nr:TFIIB-type zinc ribbon-containing protein [Lachnospiraceae bacterium]